MPRLWALLALGCLGLCWGVRLQPQLASVTFATNNPTLSTVALEKPLCVFDSTEALYGSYEIYLYALVDSGSPRNASVRDSANTPLSATFQQTGGGSTGPYKAVAFDLTPCSDLPNLDAVGDVSQASEILDAYLVRVGANGTCLSDPNFQGVCNPPLSAATEYRFKYVLVNMSTGLVQDETLWSNPIRTRQSTPYAAIDTWPGRRSGGMIVITSILGSLPFFLLLGVAGAVVLSLMDVGGPDGETTHDSQITQEAVPRSLGTSEPSYGAVNRGLPRTGPRRMAASSRTERGTSRSLLPGPCPGLCGNRCSPPRPPTVTQGQRSNCRKTFNKVFPRI